MSSTTRSPSGQSLGQSFRMSDGDWICEDDNCQNINFARRLSCNLCGKERPNDGKNKDKDKDKDKDSDKKRKMGHEIGKVAAEKSKGLFSADDWQCGRCGNVNWARRSTCNMCSAPKFGDNEERTGLGGGYNEREEHVEYIERSESDDEYDDFGRKKKKIRRSDTKSESNDDSKDKIQSNSHSSRHKSDDNSEEEDDDSDEANVSKYKLESDEDSDEEEEDGDDEDLSKYDLSDCLDDKK